MGSKGFAESKKVFDFIFDPKFPLSVNQDGLGAAQCLIKKLPHVE